MISDELADLLKTVSVVQKDSELVCSRCERLLCSIDDGDTLLALANVVLEHMCDVPTINDYMELPKGVYFAIDEVCPGCGHPSRRARIDGNGHPVFSCAKCDHVSWDRYL